MFIVVVIFILMSVYVVQNNKLKDSTKNGWFVFLGVVSILTIVLEVLGG